MNDSGRNIWMLEQQFLGFVDRIGISNSNAHKIWAVVKEYYSEPNRKYHTLEHISQMLYDFDTYCRHHRRINNSFDLDYKNELEAAIWFHDIVMITNDGKGRVPNNSEQLSAEMAWDLLSESTSLDLSLVHKYILLTRHSQSIKPETVEEELILDLDLAILGKHAVIFDKYEKDIRFEYKHVPEETYRTVRASVLEKFRQSENLFHTEFFRDKYQAAAKANLGRSIEMLNDRSKPLDAELVR